MLQLIEMLRSTIERRPHHPEVPLSLRLYRQYLSDHAPYLHSARYQQEKLLSLLDNPNFHPTEDTIEQAKFIATQLCNFGHPCLLFNDYIYFNAITGNISDSTDLAEITLHLNQAIKTAKTSTIDGRTSAADIREIAALTYHKTSLLWISNGVFPLIHSPYRPTR